ncbi:MAG: hypothetical protein QOE70_4726 [Chthoniobacter sp.]|nr:hypothetical protein [Chthoniobacter sp.]
MAPRPIRAGGFSGDAKKPLFRSSILRFFLQHSRVKTPLLLIALICSHAGPVGAILFDSTGDPTFNTSAPDGALAGSGWQFQGMWGNFLGTPIAPNYFITAAHVGGAPGDAFVYHGVPYTTDALFSDPGTDLRIWRVTTAFPDYAPLYTRNNEMGREMVIFGRGTERGTEERVEGALHGWRWGASTGVMRWGTNTVVGVVNDDVYGELLEATFDHGASQTEAHLSVGDSGGAAFIKDGETWKLAGINLGVSGRYYTAPGSPPFDAALFDQTGYYVVGSSGSYDPVTGPGSLYPTRISSRLDFILGTIPEPTSLELLGLVAAGLATLRRRRRS